MIDKNFYLENLSAFDILIQDEDQKEAKAVIYRVFSMLQRDKIWLNEIASDEEISDDDAALLAEVEEELNELDSIYGFQFAEFYQLVQQEMKKMNVASDLNLNRTEPEDLADDKEGFDDETEDDFEFQDDETDEFEDEKEDNIGVLSHLSDEEIDLVPDFILASAKTRFNYTDFLENFPVEDEASVEEDFLFPIIAGKAFGETTGEIAEKMVYNFSEIGYGFELEELAEMIDQKGKELGPEILAFKIAADSLQQGAHPNDVIQQISQLLRP